MNIKESDKYVKYLQEAKQYVENITRSVIPNESLKLIVKPWSPLASYSSIMDIDILIGNPDTAEEFFFVFDLPKERVFDLHKFFMEFYDVSPFEDY